MNILEMARRHWTQFLPQKVEKLREQGMLEASLMIATRNVNERLQELREQRYRTHEAQEVARAEFIMLLPEPTDEDDWEAVELAELEANNLEMMREYVDEVPPDPDKPPPSR